MMSAVSRRENKAGENNAVKVHNAGGSGDNGGGGWGTMHTQSSLAVFPVFVSQRRLVDLGVPSPVEEEKEEE